MSYCSKLYNKYNGMDPEVRRYWRNWIVMYSLSSLMGISYFVFIPSLHQFVTSSSSPDDPHLRPGLGLSETWYSWIVSMSSLGKLIGAIVTGNLTRWFYLKHLMLVNLCTIAIGGIFYGIGKFGWMLMLGRFCMGLYLGGQMTILRTYLGETSTIVIAMLPPEKQKKSKIKYTNFFIAFTVTNVCVGIGAVLSGIAAQFPNLDQFRWPGYYIAIHSVVLVTLVLVFFREKWTDLERGKCLCTTATRKLPIPIYTIGYLVFAFIPLALLVSVLDTLENPILGDNFGLTIKYTSYVLAATVVFSTASISVTYILQRCGVDNRVTAIACFVLGFAGAVIAADWQSIRGDPCEQFSANNFVAYSNYSTLSNTSSYCELNVRDYHCFASDINIDLRSCDSNTSSSCICEAFSGSPHHCFWNPNSRLTGEQCSRCEPLCRSVDHSINFVQFIVGVCMITFAGPMGRLSLTLITSDALGTASHGLIMGLIVASVSAARFTGPHWENAAYLAAGRRTYIPMSILSGLLATTLVLFLLLCRSMTPKETSTSSSSSGESQDDDMKLEEKAEDQQSLLKNMVTEDDPATIELNE